MPFGVIVIGPPGSGKTTFCYGLAQFLQPIGRKCALVNLDPANDFVPYTPAVDIRELVHLPEVMESHGLGPNGGLLFCMDALRANMDWLYERLAKFDDHFFVFDCPGQAELFVHDTALRKVVADLTKANFRIAAVNLVDSFYCSDAGKFVSAVLLSLSTMLQLELPHVNVLSKIDLVASYGDLAQSLDSFAEARDLEALVAALPATGPPGKLGRLTRAIAELCDDFSLVSFIPMDVSDKESVARVVDACDKATGYLLGSTERRFAEGTLIAESTDHASAGPQAAEPQVT